MKKYLFEILCLLIVAVLPACSDGDIGRDAMIISSSAFKEGEPIPSKYTCDGEDVNPSLIFGDIPADAKALALIVDDPDAPRGTWYHWIMWNIDPSVTQIKEDSVPAGAVSGITSFGTSGYGGACPPGGQEHRYFFKLYALDSKLALSPDSSTDVVNSEIAGHTLAKAHLMGRYSRK